MSELTGYNYVDLRHSQQSKVSFDGLSQTEFSVIAEMRGLQVIRTRDRSLNTCRSLIY